MMDVERIEQALRAGPPDEPRYVPGSFRHGRPRSRIRSVLLTGGVAVAVAIGVVMGLALGALRPPGGLVGGARDQADPSGLRGRWVSQGMARSAWIDALLAKGHRQEDIDAFLVHDPFLTEVHYEIEVTDDRILISGVFDEGPPMPLSGGPYRFVGPSTFRYDDVGCDVTVQFEVAGDWLSFDPPLLESCDADERIANTAFFNQWPYTRRPPP